MINRIKKLSDVTLQHKPWPAIIPRDFSSENFKPIHAPMRAFEITRSIRIKDKMPVENRVERLIHGLIKNPVSYTGFVYLAKLWVLYKKDFVRLRLPCTGHKPLMQCKNIVFQMELK